jgi:putative FmdB family regulatory protein
MPIYEYRCDCGGTVEVLAALGSPAPVCPACGAVTCKLVSGFALGGRADAGVSRSLMPQTWKGTYRGNREYVTSLQRQWEQRCRLEERYPELAGDSRPVVAHEGRYSAVPLRAGDTAASTGARGSGDTADAPSKEIVGGGHHHAHPHGHPHTHPERPHPPAA